jgi:hypothetical protein
LFVASYDTSDIVGVLGAFGPGEAPSSTYVLHPPNYEQSNSRRRPLSQTTAATSIRGSNKIILDQITQLVA